MSRLIEFLLKANNISFHEHTLANASSQPLVTKSIGMSYYDPPNLIMKQIKEREREIGKKIIKYFQITTDIIFHTNRNKLFNTKKMT